jgi:hypothetical protein
VRSKGDVGCRDDVQEVLVCYETCFGGRLGGVLEREVIRTFVHGFERVVQWLGNVGEMGPE